MTSNSAMCKREALIRRAASPWRGCALLADKRGRRHLPASHAIDRIVDEEDGDLFPAIGGMDYLRRADCCEVAIALIGDDDLVGTGALHSRGRRRARGHARPAHSPHRNSNRRRPSSPRGLPEWSCSARPNPRALLRSACARRRGRSRGSSASGAADLSCARRRG